MPVVGIVVLKLSMTTKPILIVDMLLAIFQKHVQPGEYIKPNEIVVRNVLGSSYFLCWCYLRWCL